MGLNVKILKTEDGPHPGWVKTYFRYRGVRWNLLSVVSETEPRSYLYLVETQENLRALENQENSSGQQFPPPSFLFSLTFHDSISVLSACSVIDLIQSSYTLGIQKGKRTTLQVIRSALGL
jgi:hypothetical protein